MLKRAFAFSFYVFIAFIKAQTIVKFSDGKTYESIIISREKKEINLSKKEIKSFVFKNEDKVIYNNKFIDFVINNDTLVFFDKVKEIEGINLVPSDLRSKTEKNIGKKNYKNNFYVLNSNNSMGTFVAIDTNNKITYVKSISVFPTMKNKEIFNAGKMKIEILNNVDGIPDEKSPILSFDEDVEEIKTGVWNIVFPRIIKYPENGFFIVFKFLYKDNNIYVLSFKATQESNVFYFNPKNEKKWMKDESQGILFKLKILQ